MFYIYRIMWSQTDQETVIVNAESQELAQDFIDVAYADARYREGPVVTAKMFEA